MKTNITNLKARLRNLTFNLAKPILRGFIQGSAIAIGFLTTGLLAVAVTGNIKTWTAGETLTSSDLNTTIASLQSAITSIPEWTKNGTISYYTAGNVAIGTTTTTSAFNVRGGGNQHALRIDNDGTAVGLFMQQISGSPTASYIDINDGFGNPILDILSNGRVGIGTTTPSEKLTVAGNIRIESTATCVLGGGAGATSCTSDSRMKKDIVPLKNSLEKITELNGVSFSWKKESSSEKRIGVIAQNVEKVFPELVTTDEKSGYKMVSHSLLIAPIIEAIKELKTLYDIEKVSNEKLALQLAEIEKSRNALTNENATLKNEISSLRADVKALKSFEERLSSMEKSQMQMARK